MLKVGPETTHWGENEHHKLLIYFNSAFQLFSTWVATCPADKLQGCYRERLFHFSWTIYWAVRFSNPTRYRKLDPHLQLLEHTSTCSLVHCQCSTCTLLYPVSLLSGRWDRWSQKPKYQYRDHLVGQLTSVQLLTSQRPNTANCPILLLIFTAHLWVGSPQQPNQRNLNCYVCFTFCQVTYLYFTLQAVSCGHWSQNHQA